MFFVKTVIQIPNIEIEIEKFEFKKNHCLIRILLITWKYC